MFTRTNSVCTSLIVCGCKILHFLHYSGAPYKYHPAGAKFLEWLYGAYTRREYVGLKQQEIRSFVHVQDVVKVIMSLMETYASKTMSLKGVEGVEENICNKVYNMGGPHNMSRLDVARQLCRVLGTELIVHDHCQSKDDTNSVVKGKVSESDPWEVYIMDPLPPVTAVSADQPAAVENTSTHLNPTIRLVFDELRSPRDISMDSTATEVAFGRFVEVDSILLESLSVN